MSISNEETTPQSLAFSQAQALLKEHFSSFVISALRVEGARVHKFSAWSAPEETAAGLTANLFDELRRKMSDNQR